MAELKQNESQKKRGRPLKAETKQDHRLNLRVTSEVDAKITYWAEKLGVTRTQLMLDAFHHYIGWVNADYDLPTAEIARMNQMMDVIVSLSETQQNLETTVLSGFDSIVGLVRGENYLTQAESGDL